jgi:hypothetical protein
MTDVLVRGPLIWVIESGTANVCMFHVKHVVRR